MKKTLTLVTLLAGAVGAYSQGTVLFADYQASWSIAIWSPQTQSPTVEQTGNTSTDTPAGSTAYTGVPIGGAAGSGTAPSSLGATGATYGDGNWFTVALWGAAGLNDTLTSANQLASATLVSSFGTGTANIVGGGNGLAGSWSTSQIVTIPSSVGGSTGTATVELAAWYNGGNSSLTYAQALADGYPTGLSGTANLSGLGGTSTSTIPANQPVVLSGIPSFSLTTAAPVPEPSTIALGMMGASVLFLRFRRK